MERSLALVLTQVLLLHALVLPVRAQIPQLESGTRVRVSATSLSSERLAGTLVASDSEAVSLILAEPPETGSTIRIPIDAIEGLERSLGEQSNTRKGLGLGALSGLVIGAGFMAIVCATDGSCDSDGASTAGWMAVGAIVGTGAGAVVGMVIGGFVTTERWDHVYPVTESGDADSR